MNEAEKNKILKLLLPRKEYISFESKKRSYDIDECNHSNVIVDENLYYVECKKCGEHLEPIKYLHKLAIKENGLEWRIFELQKIIEKQKRRVRTKCQNCGKMTSIN